MLEYSAQAWAWWVPSVTSARHGYVTVASVYKRTPVHVPYKMRCVWSVTAVSGITGAACTSVRSVMGSCARTTSLNIRRPARCWSRRITSANLATDWANIRVFVVKLATVMITSRGKVSSTRKTRPFRVPSVAMRRRRPRILACPPAVTSLVDNTWSMKMATMMITVAGVRSVMEVELDSAMVEAVRLLGTTPMMKMMMMKTMTMKMGRTKKMVKIARERK
uniref:Uncharacterized protein n=1 Tax=Cacopsylla melanoneura TaxID=428564 RepID=A0A8D8M5M0_9HEMI